MFNILFKSKLKYWLLFFASLIFIAYQIDNTPRTDDEYLGEQVYWLQHVGKVKSDFGYTMLGYDTYQSIFHKLYVYIGYVFSKAFGWSLLSLHLVSFLFFLAFIAVFYQWCKKEYGDTGNFRFYGVLLLLLLNQDVLYAAADFRPEVMLMCLGFASYAFLMRYLKDNTTAALVGSAICAGLCMFAHLNGAIFVVAGVLFLFSKKKIKAGFIYGIVSVIVFLPYFFDVMYNADFSYFRNQFFNDPILNAQHRYWYTPCLKLLEEQSRFLYNEKQVVLTAMLLVVLIGTFKKLKENNRDLLFYTLILVIAMALINPSKTTKYMVVYLPFLYLIIMEGWYWLDIMQKKKLVITFQVLLVASVGISLFYSARQISSNIDNLQNGGIVAESEQILKHVPEDLSTLHFLGPRMLVFNDLGKLKRLQDIEMISKADFVDVVRASDVDYVVFSLRDKAYFNLPELLQQERGLLEVRDSTKQYVLVKVKRN